MPKVAPNQKVPDTSGDVVQIKERRNGKLLVMDYKKQEVAEMPLATYYRKKDKLFNARKMEYYDRFLIDPAAPWTEGKPATLFVRGKSEEGVVHNTGTEINEKTDYHTNMASGGEFGNDETVIVHAVELRLLLTSVLPIAANVQQGIINNATPRVEGATEWSASLAFAMLMEQVKLEFYRGDQLMLSGFLGEFTCRVGATGSFGGDGNEGFIQNVIPVENSRLDRPELFENGKFRFVLRPVVPSMQFPAWINGRVILRARRIGAMYA